MWHALCPTRKLGLNSTIRAGAATVTRTATNRLVVHDPHVSVREAGGFVWAGRFESVEPSLPLAPEMCRPECIGIEGEFEALLETTLALPWLCHRSTFCDLRVTENELAPNTHVTRFYGTNGRLKLAAFQTHTPLDRGNVKVCWSVLRSPHLTPHDGDLARLYRHAMHAAFN